MVQNETASKARVIRDKAFAKRLETAIYNHAHATKGHGKQKWLREKIESRFGTKVSPEAVRKWFTGEARPRPSMMSQVAQALEVDEAWLSLDLKPNASPDEKRQHNAAATGAVNLVAGMIQMNGSHIAYPDEPSESVDLYAIIGTKQYSLLVRTPQEIEGAHRVIVPNDRDRSVVIVVIQAGPLSFSLLRLNNELIESHGANKGGYREIDLEFNGQAYSLGKDVVPVIVNLNNLDGERPIQRRG